jgi:3'-phosphoadenosine 5'-phosphosulfate (PAPS) 3'-phosphatase
MQSILHKVGATLLELRMRGVVSGKWEGTQLKSEADRLANQILTLGLRSLTPDIPVVSEEDPESHIADRNAQYWITDPLDGTASFCGGYSGFVTQLALVVEGEVIRSAVYAPALGSMYIAEKNKGAFLNGVRLGGAINVENSVTLIDNYPTPRGIANHLMSNLPCKSYIECGSIGLKICKVASRHASLFVKDVVIRDWDIAPGQLILEQSGGYLRDLAGNNINYDGSLEKTGGLIAANSMELIKKVSAICIVDE